MRTIRWITAAPLALLLMAGEHATAQTATVAAEPKVITLSCNGTLTETMMGKEQPPEQMDNVGVVVNLDERTVSFLGFVAHINGVDAAYIQFSQRDSERERDGFDGSIRGEIDRVTGYFEARRDIFMKNSTKETDDVAGYKMLCKATNRVF